jgi:hypothetical protein
LEKPLFKYIGFRVVLDLQLLRVESSMFRTGTPSTAVLFGSFYLLLFYLRYLLITLMPFRLDVDPGVTKVVSKVIFLGVKHRNLLFSFYWDLQVISVIFISIGTGLSDWYVCIRSLGLLDASLLRFPGLAVSIAKEFILSDFFGHLILMHFFLCAFERFLSELASV